MWTESLGEITIESPPPPPVSLEMITYDTCMWATQPASYSLSNSAAQLVAVGDEWPYTRDTVEECADLCLNQDACGFFKYYNVGDNAHRSCYLFEESDDTVVYSSEDDNRQSVVAVCGKPLMYNNDFDADYVESDVSRSVPRDWYGMSGSILLSLQRSALYQHDSGNGVNYLALENQGAEVSQKVYNLQAGGSYRVSYMAASAAGDGIEQKLLVAIGGTKVRVDALQEDFVAYELYFYPDSDSVSLSFTSASPRTRRGNNTVILLDKIRVTAIDPSDMPSASQPDFIWKVYKDYTGEGTYG
ncbi:hypothetical protein CYMTET_51900, partial [Cymbomonas tetramitiformis]